MTTFVLVAGAWHGPWAWDRVNHVILVDGWAGPDGTSLYDLAPDPFVQALQALTADGLIAVPPPVAFGIDDPDDAAWLAERMRPQPARTFTEPTRLTGAVDRIPGTAIFCRPQTYAFEQCAKAIGYRTVPIDGPHDVMLARPDALARLLAEPRA
jgi:hypothetical protein